MFYNLLRFLKEEKASVMSLSAVIMPMAVGVLGVGVDASLWLKDKRNLQAAADAAVIAATYEIINGAEDDEARLKGIEEAELNGFLNNNSDEFTLTIEEVEGTTYVTARVSQQTDIYFSKLFIDGDVFISAAAATAMIDEPEGACFMSLDESESKAISIQGNATVDAVGCDFAVNSNADDAFYAKGSVDVDVNNLNVVGGVSIGSSSDVEYNSVNKVQPYDDPYEDLEVPSFSACSKGDSKKPESPSGDTTYSPDSGNIKVFCGGLSISGNSDIEFEPGVYVIDGGDFKITGGGTITGEGVTFILTNSGNGSYGNLNISGNRQIEFSAPLEGEDYEGVVIYQDRDAPESKSQNNKLTGTADLDIWGTVYTPTRSLEFGGNHSSSSDNQDPCTRMIAKSISLSGNPNVGNGCDGFGVRDVSQKDVKLVL